jgi:phospholipid/cholesterol/gamma-HCH transport system substrate-binding protein
VAARPGRSFGATSSARPLAGLATVVAIGLIFGLAVALFRGSFTKTEPITLISDRAGLVMNPDAKVKMRGVQVGTVSSIEQRPDGKAVLHLAMNPAQLRLIPGNVQADIASTTVFGAKYVQLVAPENPSSEKLRPGQTLQGDHVTVEMNTVFQQLTNVLNKIDPAKLNETLGALSSAEARRWGSPCPTSTRC